MPHHTLLSVLPVGSIRSTIKLSVVPLAVVFAIVMSSCDDTVFDPFSNDGKYFTVYGYLDEFETRHEIRVVPITRFPAVIETPTAENAEIDAVVTVDEIEGGEVIATHVWTHRLEQLSDGTYGHVFSSEFRVWPGRTYQLLITREDGTVTSAQTTVPRVIASNVVERGPMLVNADSTVISQELVVPPPISAPWLIRAIYTYEGGLVNQGRVFVPYEQAGEPTDEGGWKVTIYPLADTSYIYRDAEHEMEVGRLEPGDPLILIGMGVDYQMLDADWKRPDSILDPDLLSQPGSFSNVENGFGFFGSIGYYREFWNGRPFSELFGFSDAGT